MNASEVSQYITETFVGVDVVLDSDNSFFFYNPDSDVPPDHRFPFVTLVTNDLNDQFSNLNRPGIYRLNIGVSKQTFQTLLGSPVLPSPEASTTINEQAGSIYDFTALNQILPHPVYGRMLWVCILNPTEETFTTQVHPLLAEAYEMAVNKYRRRAARRDAPGRDA